MARDMESMILSFGEIQEPHECVTIAYAGVRVESSKLYEGVYPTDAMKEVIIYLQQQAQELNGDGVKNIDVKVVTTKDKNGIEVIDFLGQGTIIRLK
ncbi:hypothetical protein FE773_08240 [Caminibacter mediatlanticus TB-2]|uniref:50S ribosomal protein L19 n=1 Tax=Caminibacter mediatlanticus TB-2 TaxID=391592 RepID=A0AAI9AJB9_9BACT|nr:hypothetical protein [Caminibacter mediatlanticus]EDM24534.1 50S ribosomal protein L19 [Caminibacter mediatlanticus TB-2]QCT95179.1 hypothetical protein FE773_08240 [Caminibacter mediatlanticus TB-2]